MSSLITRHGNKFDRLQCDAEPAPQMLVLSQHSPWVHTENRQPNPCPSVELVAVSPQSFIVTSSCTESPPGVVPIWDRMNKDRQTFETVSNVRSVLLETQGFEFCAAVSQWECLTYFYDDFSSWHRTVFSFDRWSGGGTNGIKHMVRWLNPSLMLNSHPAKKKRRTSATDGLEMGLIKTEGWGSCAAALPLPPYFFHGCTKHLLYTMFFYLLCHTSLGFTLVTYAYDPD